MTRSLGELVGDSVAYVETEDGRSGILRRSSCGATRPRGTGEPAGATGSGLVRSRTIDGKLTI